MKKTAIVCSGGGMRCAYTGGFLVGLAEKFPQEKPDIIVAASGGAGSAVYYLTDQLVEMKNNWTNLFASRLFINPYRFWKIMDVDYAINNVFRNSSPLLVSNLLKCKTEWYIPVTEVSTHTSVYFSKKDIARDKDIFDLIHATISIPKIYGKTKILYGNKYIDGCISAPFYKTVEKAIFLGATHILAIDASHRQDENMDIYKGENITIELIRNYKIPATRISHNPKILSETFQMGYLDAIHNSNLEKFLQI